MAKPIAEKKKAVLPLLSTLIFQFWPPSSSDFAFSSDVELIFAINRVILNLVNLK